MHPGFQEAREKVSRGGGCLRPSKSEAARSGKPASIRPGAGGGEPSGLLPWPELSAFSGPGAPALIHLAAAAWAPRVLHASASCLAFSSWSPGGLPGLVTGWGPPTPHAQFLHSVQTMLACEGQGHGGPPDSGATPTGSAPQIWIQVQGALGTSLASGLLMSLSFKARLPHQPSLPDVQGGKTGSFYALPSHPAGASQMLSLPPFPGEGGIHPYPHFWRKKARLGEGCSLMRGQGLHLSCFPLCLALSRMPGMY